MNNGFFKFLNNLSQELNNGSVETLDFTKKEDVEKLEKAVETLKTNEFFGTLFGEDLFDTLLEKAHQIYFEAHKNDKKAPQRPSVTTSKVIQNNVKKLAIEYVETTVTPYVKNMDEKQKNDIIDSLFEFGCWIYNK